MQTARHLNDDIQSSYVPSSSQHPQQFPLLFTHLIQIFFGRTFRSTTLNQFYNLQFLPVIGSFVPSLLPL